MKAVSATNAKTLKDIPNIGPAMIDTFNLLKIYTPKDLKKHDPYLLYKKLCKITGERHDPCVLDVFIATIAFMNGAPPTPWYYYTQERKKIYSNI